MSTAQQTHDQRRFRLAANDNEIVVTDDAPDTEGHRLATNDNETTVERMRRAAESEQPGPLGGRRSATPDDSEGLDPLGARWR